MIGDSELAGFIDQIFAQITDFLKVVMDFLITAFFYNKFIAFFIAFVVINLIAIILMKRDKEYANTGEKRIRERTLLLVALMGGALGEYYAMYKFKHKTLHKNFLYIVPLAIVFHFALLSYNLLIGIIG